VVRVGLGEWVEKQSVVVASARGTRPLPHLVKISTNLSNVNDLPIITPRSFSRHKLNFHTLRYTRKFECYIELKNRRGRASGPSERLEPLSGDFVPIYGAVSRGRHT
jgi:hypothetical protein